MYDVFYFGMLLSESWTTLRWTSKNTRISNASNYFTFPTIFHCLQISLPTSLVLLSSPPPNIRLHLVTQLKIWFLNITH